MKQNIYDNEHFFIQYQQMRHNELSLNQLYEHPTIRAMLPAITDCKVLDIGCGCGELSEYLVSKGASSILSIDISQRMIDLAKKKFHNIPAINFECSAFEDVILKPDYFNLVVSSVALHYIEDFYLTCEKISQSLQKDGYLIFSMEHPILTANKTDWLLDINGHRKYNIVMDYFKEGSRSAQWLGADVTSYHRSFSTIINSLTDTGFLIEKIEEQGFLFIRARKSC